MANYPMPWTLYRYTFRELCKLLATSAVVLVVVVSLAAAIKPLSEGLLGPTLLARYILYLSPTMLGFAMPFAGAFAATLVFVRMASDNELVVCRACGMSYRSILLPVALLGLVIMVGMFYLSNWVVPTFNRHAALMLEQDLSQLLVTRVRQGLPVTIGEVVLYADQVDDSRKPPVVPGSVVQPSKLIMLRGVAAGRLDDDGRLRRDCTAEAADMMVYRVDGQSWATMRLRNVMYFDAVRGDLLFVEQWMVPQFQLPSPFKDNIRFMSWPELRGLRRDPERYDSIAKQKLELAGQIAAEELLRAAAGQLGDAGGGVLTLQGSVSGEQYVITSPGVERNESRLELFAGSGSGGAVTVAYWVDGLVQRQVQAANGTLWVESEGPGLEPRVHLEVRDARVRDAQLPGQEVEQSSLVLPIVAWSKPLAGPLSRLGLDRLLELSRRDYEKADTVQRAGVRLDRLLRQLASRVITQVHERAALALAGMLVLMLSAVIGMSMRGSLPLVAYFWSFITAIIVVVITYSGQNLASGQDANRTLALVVLWSGDVLLLVAVVLAYSRLARN
jgi:lipopolysaccharide export system permease protein